MPMRSYKARAALPLQDHRRLKMPDAARTGAAAAATTRSYRRLKMPMRPAQMRQPGTLLRRTHGPEAPGKKRQCKLTSAQTATQYRDLIVIGPGHQQYGNSEQEPVGPRSSGDQGKSQRRHKRYCQRCPRVPTDPGYRTAASR